MAEDQTPPAAQKTVDAIVRQALDDHLRSLVKGDPARVRYDFAESVRDRVPAFEALLPANIERYQVLGDSIAGDTSRLIVRLEGDEPRELEWVWQNVDGRFRIVDVRVIP
mgnify:CR=1 FL=1